MKKDQLPLEKNRIKNPNKHTRLGLNSEDMLLFAMCVCSMQNVEDDNPSCLNGHFM